jgi:hypothetical protein
MQGFNECAGRGISDPLAQVTLELIPQRLSLFMVMLRRRHCNHNAEVPYSNHYRLEQRKQLSKHTSGR